MIRTDELDKECKMFSCKGGVSMIELFNKDEIDEQSVQVIEGGDKGRENERRD